jgi:hypothetical protein
MTTPSAEQERDEYEQAATDVERWLAVVADEPSMIVTAVSHCRARIRELRALTADADHEVREAIAKARRGVNGTEVIAHKLTRAIEELELVRGRIIGVDEVLEPCDTLGRPASGGTAAVFGGGGTAEGAE